MGLPMLAHPRIDGVDLKLSSGHEAFRVVWPRDRVLRTTEVAMVCASHDDHRRKARGESDVDALGHPRVILPR